MLFNSYEFIFFFLPLSFFIYFYLNSKRMTEASKGFLVVSSLFFYSWWNIIYLPLILSSMLFNYIIGRTINKDETDIRVAKKQLLIIGIITNIALLGYFKYADFFISNINFVFSSDMGLLELALPLALSFFTFQQIAYLVDSYKGETKEYDFLNYAVFVSFFPQLIAGPIVHHKEMMPQFASIKNKVIQYRNISLGLFIFSIGLFKKVVIADTFAIWASSGFDNAETLSLLEAWATSLSYTFQLYFDFSGYTDMAIGAALLFNIKLPINFNSPYKATNIQDFWRRWHITLSRFLKEYIYIPLGGNRSSNFRTYSNLMITFLIGGLWHGAGWTFVFWGFLHGMALVVHRIWEKVGFGLSVWLAWLITFNFINISWVFFRAQEWSDAIAILKAMFFGKIVLSEKFENLSLFSYIDFPVVFGEFVMKIREETLWLIILSFIVVLTFQNTKKIMENFRPSYVNMVLLVVFFTVSIAYLSRYSEFLYFNF